MFARCTAAPVVLCKTPKLCTNFTHVGAEAASVSTICLLEWVLSKAFILACDAGECSMASGTIYTAPECGTASAASCTLCAATPQLARCVKDCADRVSISTVRLLTETTNKYNKCSK